MNQTTLGPWTANLISTMDSCFVKKAHQLSAQYKYVVLQYVIHEDISDAEVISVNGTNTNTGITYYNTVLVESNIITQYTKELIQ